jgi:hypothetical protein
MSIWQIYWYTGYLGLGSSVERVMSLTGRAVAQAVSSWLPTAAARVHARVWLSGICGEQSGAGAGAGFLRVLRFPIPILIPQNYPSS